MKSGGYKEIEDKGVERRPMAHGDSLHEMCYPALKVLGRLGNATEAASNSKLFALFGFN